MSDDNGGGGRATEPVDYAAINIAFTALLAGVAAVARRHDDDPIRGAELLPVGAATFTLAKAISKERIGTWARAPFVDEDAGHRPRGRRVRRALGELVTCSRCMGAWSALGVVGLRVADPRAGRAVTNVLAAAALNDWLQAAFNLLCDRSNMAARAAEAPARARARD